MDAEPSGQSERSRITTYTLHGLILDVFERLEVPGEQGFEFEPVVGMGGVQTRGDCRAKRIKGRIIARIEALFTDKPPKALDQVQMGRIRREIEEFNPKICGILLHERTPLIAHIIQNNGDREAIPTGREFCEQLTDGVSRHGGLVDDGNEFLGQGIYGTEHIQAMTPGWTGEKEPGETPEPA